jgi:hypothetical protein
MRVKVANVDDVKSKFEELKQLAVKKEEPVDFKTKYDAKMKERLAKEEEERELKRLEKLKKREEKKEKEKEKEKEVEVEAEEMSEELKAMLGM